MHILIILAQYLDNVEIIVGLLQHLLLVHKTVVALLISIWNCNQKYPPHF